MLRIVGMSFAALAACTPAGVPDVGGDLRVVLVEDYYWPSPVAVDGGPMIDVFPLVTALVVASRDGRPLGEGDEAASREAAGAYCAATGEVHPADASGRLSEGVWAFSPCTAPAA